jgi:molecular chaperone DnaJ
VDLPVSVAEAIQGATVEVPTLNGSKRIRIPAGTQNGTTQRLRGEGPPRPNGRDKGDIYYRVRLEVPTDLSGEQRQAVEQLAEAFNGHDPREELLREAARSGGSGKVDG